MKTCKDCIYMLPINSYTEDDGIRTYNGECRFFPDSVYVKSDYWCGQLKAKVTKEDRKIAELAAGIEIKNIQEEINKPDGWMPPKMF